MSHDDIDTLAEYVPPVSRKRAPRQRPDDQDHQHNDAGDGDAAPGCTIAQLPDRLAYDAATVAARINPVNAPSLAHAAAFAVDGVIEPMRLTLLTAKYFGPAPRRLTVKFLEATPNDLANRILSHMNAWNSRCGISFVRTNGTGQVRISRGGGGYWSYLGTDIFLIPSNRPTMNLQGFTMNTPEREYRRVVRHETGHTMGFPHEHMRRQLIARINRNAAYAYFLRTQGWDRAMVDAQVLTPLNDATIIGTPADQDSIMCYQLPGSITIDGQPIRGGTDINATDFRFAAQVYPKLPGHSMVDDSHGDGCGAHSKIGAWDEGDDVDVEDAVASADAAAD